MIADRLPDPELYAWTFSCGHTHIGGNECAAACVICGDTDLRSKAPRGIADRPVSAAVSPAEPLASHLAINPDPYRTRAAAMLSDENRKVRALAEVVVVMCDRYDELRAVFGVQAGSIVKSETKGWTDA